MGAFGFLGQLEDGVGSGPVPAAEGIGDGVVAARSLRDGDGHGGIGSGRSEAVARQPFFNASRVRVSGTLRAHGGVIGREAAWCWQAGIRRAVDKAVGQAPIE